MIVANSITFVAAFESGEEVPIDELLTAQESQDDESETQETVAATEEEAGEDEEELLDCG